MLLFSNKKNVNKLKGQTLPRKPLGLSFMVYSFDMTTFFQWSVFRVAFYLYLDPRDLESLGLPASELRLMTDGGSVSSDGLVTTRPYQSGVQQVLEVLRKRALMDHGKSFINMYILLPVLHMFLMAEFGEFV